MDVWATDAMHNTAQKAVKNSLFISALGFLWLQIYEKNSKTLETLALFERKYVSLH
jgi:hypothetical protein